MKKGRGAFMEMITPSLQHIGPAKDWTQQICQRGWGWCELYQRSPQAWSLRLPLTAGWPFGEWLIVSGPQFFHPLCGVNPSLLQESNAVMNKKELRCCSLQDKSQGQKQPQERSGGFVPHQGLKTSSQGCSSWFPGLWTSCGRGDRAGFPRSKPCAVQMLPKGDVVRQRKKTLPSGPELWN